LPQLSVAYTPEALADQVKNLPGAENLNIKFNQFSGYITIPGNSGDSKHLHYWFVESMNNPSTDPIAFWTNGGPGCSGLLGFLTEQGPFKPNADMSLSENEYAWNKISNMVFIEAPAGVGFSYSDDKADYTTGDAQVATDNYNLIQGFLNRFPEYRANDLYISSESYGGHYIPTLAQEIVNQNSQAATTGQKTLNFKGFAVGNPYTDPYSGTPAEIDTYWGHQLIPLPVYKEYQHACLKAETPNKAECALLAVKMLNGIGDLNPYALDYPVCLSESKAKYGRAQRIWQLTHQLAGMGIEPHQVGLKLKSEYEPCEETYATTYLNQLTVKAALHVNKDIKWNECSNKLHYNSTDMTEVSTAPIYNSLIDGKHRLNILVYSGDDDGVCGTIGTQNWIWALGYEVAGKSWKSYEVNGQVAGYLTQWKGTKLGFLTVHGAGHEVPAYKPEIAFDLWKNFLAGTFTDK